MKSIYEFLLKSKTAASTQETDYVDLELPSDLLWARCNIGADKPYEYGDYFMWGSTEPNTNDTCSWECMPFNNSELFFDKDYFDSIKNKVCPNGILVPEYDAATVILGSDWRLPTGDEFQELIDNTTHEWITNYQDSKINGILFQANSIENDAELFIPASGYCGGSSFNGRGSYAHLWSSSLSASRPSAALSLNFHNSSCNMRDLLRYYGFCMHGVKEN